MRRRGHCLLAALWGLSLLSSAPGTGMRPVAASLATRPLTVRPLALGGRPGGLAPATTWTPQAELTASDGASADAFGRAVALSGNTVLIGAPSLSSHPPPGALGVASAGAAYVFVRVGQRWRQQATLTPADGAAGDRFGASVALSGNTAVVGAPASNGRAGAAYVFGRLGTAWTQQARLTASDGAPGDAFGTVALSGNTMLVGAPGTTVQRVSAAGAAYVFGRNDTTWSEQAELADPLPRRPCDHFGHAVALSGTTVLVGAPGKTRGAAYLFGRLFGRRGRAWPLQATLTARGAAGDGSFGAAVSLSGETALVGAPGHPGTPGAAVVFVFDRRGMTWRPQSTLSASSAAGAASFGRAVALSGSLALVGAGGGRGAAFIFGRRGTTWLPQAHLADRNAAARESFGVAVSLGPITALIGVPGVTSGTPTDQGAVFVFGRAGSDTT